MVGNSKGARPRGRPKAFNPEIGLDRAVETFWRVGYAGADMQMLADAMGVSKPSVYDAFGGKEQLFMLALERYGQTIGSEPLIAFRSAAHIRDGVEAFFEAVAVNVSGARGSTGCLHACVAAQCTETLGPVREFLAAGLAAADDTIAARFREAAAATELPFDFPAKRRARLMTDLMQALALRARAGAPLVELRAIASDNVAVVLAAAA
jgi:AcrR family transcriptional regulator